MESQFYVDCPPPHLGGSITSVTLASTNKALYTVANIRAMGKDFWRAGRKVRIEAFGAITTAATPGNLTLAVLYGTGADANGTSIVACAAQTLIASQTNISWRASIDIRCVTEGATGTLFGTGEAQFGTAVIAVGDFLMPASAPAASSAVDLTVAANVLSLQALRSGSTAETMQVHELIVSILN